MRSLVCLFCFALVASSYVHSQNSDHPDGFTTLNIGDSIPQFDLPGVDDRNWALDDFKESKVLMVVFTCNHCPTAQAYESRLNEIFDDYSDRGVAVVAISPNDPKAVRLDELGYSDLGDTLEDMKIRARQAGFKFPYLYDGENQKVSLSFGVLATPHVFIFDSERKLRYKGRIDNSESGKPTKLDARNAIDAILAGKQVTVEQTRVFGCSTKWFTKRKVHDEFRKKWSQEPVSLSSVEQNELESIVKNDSGKLRLINVWATWCAPCIEELPELVTINRMYRGREFEMVTVSADNASELKQATELLREKNVSCRNVLFSPEQQDLLFETIDPKWSGGFPYTMLVAPGGKVVYRKQGSIDPVALKGVIADSVGRTFASDDVSIEEKVKQLKRDDVKPGANFATENLVPWCMVAFDAKERSPEQRAQMIVDLGLKRGAYAWRPKHLPEFEREIEAYREKGIEYRAFFNWHESMEPLIKKHGIKPEIWHYMEENPTGTQREKVEKIAAKIMPIVDRTRELGLKFALYNHRGWTGEPENMVAVIEHIRATQPDSDHVGIVYNFHHGHGDIADFEQRFKTMLPYLVCVNLNGMVLPELVDEKSMKNKILTIGEGAYEEAMIKTVIESGYAGPIGIINHRSELDAKTALQDNIDGLQRLLEKLSSSD